MSSQTYNPSGFEPMTEGMMGYNRQIYSFDKVGGTLLVLYPKGEGDSTRNFLGDILEASPENPKSLHLSTPFGVTVLTDFQGIKKVVLAETANTQNSGLLKRIRSLLN